MLRPCTECSLVNRFTQGGSYDHSNQDRWYPRVWSHTERWPIPSDHVGERRDGSVSLCFTYRRTSWTTLRSRQTHPPSCPSKRTTRRTPWRTNWRASWATLQSHEIRI